MQLGILALLCLLWTSLASAASPRATKLANLQQKSSTGVIRMTPSMFDEFLVASPAGASAKEPRDYSMTVLFNAIKPQQGCTPCRIFQKEYDMLATQWTRKRPDAKSDTPHFFAMVEFTEAQSVFAKMGLQTAPTTKYFPPAVGSEATGNASPSEFDIRLGPNAETLARWVVAHKQGITFKYSPPTDWTFVISVFAILSIGGYVLYQKSELLMPFVTGRYLWAVLCLAFMVTMTSGYMWVQIRKPPYMTMQGGAIASGHQNQFGVETHILTGLYALLAASICVILFSLPKVADPSIQRIGVYIWLFIFASLHALLVSLFKSKNPAYPFSFLLW